MLDKFFNLTEAKTNLKQEFIGGSTTFFTMAYIIFVQPAVLSASGMDFGAVMVATCISSALATLVMGLYARYPIALAPGMGQNLFFAYTVVLTMGISWQTTLGVVFVAGFIFIMLSFLGIREKIINAIPESLKHAIAVGIGLMITLVGLEWAGLVVDDPNLLVSLGDFSEPTTQLALFGLILAFELTGDEWYGDWFQRVHEYAFRTFSDGENGEWHQKCDRYGRPVDSVVALPVKDPFHLPRAVMFIIQSLERQLNHTPYVMIME